MRAPRLQRYTEVTQINPPPNNAHPNNPPQLVPSTLVSQPGGGATVFQNSLAAAPPPCGGTVAASPVPRLFLCHGGRGSGQAFPAPGCICRPQLERFACGVPILQAFALPSGSNFDDLSTSGIALQINFSEELTV